MRRKETPPPHYLKASDVAALFGVAQRTVWAWVAGGLIPHYKIGRSVFFCPADLERMMGRNRFVGRVRCPLEPPRDGPPSDY